MNIYNIDSYTDAELLQMLDLNHPTDRELEAKIIQNINKYQTNTTPEAQSLADFFEKVYDRFFQPESSGQEEYDNEDDDKEPYDDTSSEASLEGFQNQTSSPSNSTQTPSTSNNSTAPAPAATEKVVDAKIAQTTAIANVPGQLNPLLKESQKKMIHVDSQFRDKKLFPKSTSFDIIFTENLTNVLTIRLHSVIIPYTWYNVGAAPESKKFQLLGNSPGINNVYNFTFNIPGGTYDANGIANSINNSIKQVAANNTDVNFGSTAIQYNPTLSKMTLTLDVQNVYTECNYSVYFPPGTTPMREFLGYENHDYSLDTIYSNDYHSKMATGYTVPPGNTIPTTNPNVFNPKTSYDIIANNPEENIQGNNYFTIYNYDGTNPFDLETSTIYDTLTISFFTTSGRHTRETIMNNINNAIKNNSQLTANSSLNLLDLVMINNDGSTTMYQKYELIVELNRFTTKKRPGMKQIVIFPDEGSLPSRLWMGSSSCFMFDRNDTVRTCNNILSEKPIDTSTININSSPYILLICGAEGYDNSYNQFRINIPNSVQSGYQGGCNMNQYVGVYDDTKQYLNSVVNRAISQYFAAQNINGYVDIEVYLDQDDSRIHFYADIQINFDQTRYVLDLTNHFLCKTFGLPAIIDITDPQQNIFNVPITQSAPYIVNDSNNILILRAKPGAGNESVPVYILQFSNGLYTQTDLIEMVNGVFASIQGYSDYAGTRLYGINLAQCNVSIRQTPTPTMTFTYIVSSELTEVDYRVEFDDVTPVLMSHPKANKLTLSDKSAYFVKSVYFVDAVYNPKTSWNKYLGFAYSSYVFKDNPGKKKTNRLTSNNNTYNATDDGGMVNAEKLPVTSTINILAGQNMFYLLPQTGIKGLYDVSGTNIIKITVPPKSYNVYTLHLAIQNQFKANPLTKNSKVITYYDDPGKEYSLMKITVERIYSAKDYVLKFYDEHAAALTQYESTSTSSGRVFKPTTWNQTIGWQMGYRTSDNYNLAPTSITRIRDISNNYYTYDGSTNIVTLTSDTPLTMFLYNNFYIKIDDFVPNRLNDGLVNVTTPPADKKLPEYTSKKLIRSDPFGNQIISVKNAANPNTNLTGNQLATATTDLREEQALDLNLFSSTPYMKDLFAVVPLKLAGLQPGQTFAEFGGTLQDNNRLYFGPVTLKKMSIQLVNDLGEVVDLNGLDWSFTIICEYLYSMSSREIK